MSEISKVIAVAIIGEDGNVYSLPPPARHHDVIRKMASYGHKTPIMGEQGFLLSDGTFENRKRAFDNAVMNDQILPGQGKHRELYSEDLW